MLTTFTHLRGKFALFKLGHLFIKMYDHLSTNRFDEGNNVVIFEQNHFCSIHSESKYKKMFNDVSLNANHTML